MMSIVVHKFDEDSVTRKQLVFRSICAIELLFWLEILQNLILIHPIKKCEVEKRVSFAVIYPESFFQEENLWSRWKKWGKLLPTLRRRFEVRDGEKKVKTFLYDKLFEARVVNL